MTFEQQFHQWIERLNQTEHPSNDVIAFNFGLFETIEGFTIYLVGAKKFDAQNDDWVLEPDFEPKEEYLDLHSDELAELEPDEILKRTIDIVTKYVQSNDFKHSILKHAVAITTGFDDGSLKRIK